MPELSAAVQEMEWKLVTLGLYIFYILAIFSLPTDIQSEAIPGILGGGDVLMVLFLIRHYLVIVSFAFRRPKRGAEKRVRFACQLFKLFTNR